MPSRTENGFTKFETMLGVAVMLIALLVSIPYLTRNQSLESPVRALLGAEDIAHAVLDFRNDTGIWPLADDGHVDLAQLSMPRQTLVVHQAGAQPDMMAGAMVGGDREPAWMKEMPVDPWQRPYRAIVLGDLHAGDDGDAGLPPDGVAIVVMSAGQDGQWDTDLTRIWQTSPQDSTLQDQLFGGDDLGFVLTRADMGDLP